MTIRIEIAHNATKAKLINPDRNAKILVTDLLSYYVHGYENTYAYKNKTWNGKSTMFGWQSETFPVGFLRTVGRELQKAGYEVSVISKGLPKPLGVVPKTLGGFSYSDRYDYQWQTTEALLQRGIMIARLATGAGKTFAAALAHARIDRPTLILTKRQPLMYQFAERMRDFGFDPGLIGDGEMDIKPKLTVAMAHTLANKLDDPVIKDYLKSVEFIIGEEVHEVSDDRYWSVLQACPNAYYKLGLTATPFMKDKSEANMKLLGSFGNIGIDVTEKILIERGINATPIFKFANYDCPPALKFNSNYQKAVTEGITKNIYRNYSIVEHAVKAATYGLPVLILVGRQEHGKELSKLLKAAKLTNEFIYGETKSERRKDALAKLASGKTKVLIGSTIVDVGVDVPSIGLVIMAGGGKAEVAYRQRIGRGLREKKVGANICFILDFNDEHNRHLNDHCLERKSILHNTPGFAENFLPRGKDFPWASL